ncbi:MAG: sigma-70 family RNA polymerase sigma factor [Planctomycetia bacterium]|nr:sigma-70 family RNA polymerase sigma factor [Planctomycetia bacterium]
MPNDKKLKAQEQASQLFLDNYGLVRQTAFEAAPSLDLIDDIVNETFLYFIEKAETWDYNEKIQPLLRTVTQNIGKRMWREHLRKLPEAYVRIAESAQAVLSESTFLSDQVHHESKMTALNLCIQKLPQKTRDVVETHYLHQIPVVEIARRTGQSLSTLYKILLSARRMLHDCVMNALYGEWTHDE